MLRTERTGRWRQARCTFKGGMEGDVVGVFAVRKRAVH